MDKSAILINLLKNKEFDKLDIEELSHIIGKNLFVINTIYVTNIDASELMIFTATAEELDFNSANGSTLYFTDDKYLLLDVLSNSSDDVEINNISVGNSDTQQSLEIETIQDETGNPKIKIAEGTTPCFVNVMVELRSKQEEPEPEDPGQE